MEPVATMGCCSCQQSSLVIWLAVVTKKMIEFCVDDSFITLSLLVDVRVNWLMYSVADTSRQAFIIIIIIIIIITLAASSAKRNVTVWRPSVCQSVPWAFFP